jgi:hypothetical protein
LISMSTATNRTIGNLDVKLSELVDTESPRYEVKQFCPSEVVLALNAFASGGGSS